MSNTLRTPEKKLEIAIQLLREVRMQDFVSETAWDSAECRRWITKVDKLLDEFGGH
jgi:uncharacterized protein YllA (UPF0747 family)